MAPSVRRLGPDDWRLARAVRLAMLRDSPGAFCAQIVDEERADEQFWRQRCTSGDTLVADAGGATLVVHDGQHHLVGMWVAPAHRAAGVGEALVEAVAERARGVGADRLLLDVVDGNPRAARFYQRLGFVPTGRRQPAPAKDGVLESQLVRTL